MKLAEHRTPDPAVVHEVRAMLQPGYNVEDLIAAMRLRGFSKIDSIKFLRDYAGVPSRDGKAIVHLSPAWNDCYGSDETLHDAAEMAAEQLLNEETTAA